MRCGPAQCTCGGSQAVDLLDPRDEWVAPWMAALTASGRFRGRATLHFYWSTATRSFGCLGSGLLGLNWMAVARPHKTRGG